MRGIDAPGRSGGDGLQSVLGECAVIAKSTFIGILKL